MTICRICFIIVWGLASTGVAQTTSGSPRNSNRNGTVTSRGTTAPTTSSNPASLQPSHVAPLTYPESVVTTMPAPAPIEVLENRPLYQFTERDLDVYLSFLVEAEPDPIRRVVLLARKSIGQPYQADALGEFPFELYDPDPLYNLAKSDSITFCEQTYAMSMSNDWSSFFRLLQRLRYKKGHIGLNTRNHNMICDWARSNCWLFNEQTKILQTETREMVAIWQPNTPLEPFGFNEETPEVRIRTSYIPREFVRIILPNLEEGDFVHFLQQEKTQETLSVYHMGIIARGAKNVIDLIHASPPQVREESLVDYVDRDKNLAGLKVLRLKASPQHIVVREMRLCTIGFGR